MFRFIQFCTKVVSLELKFNDQSVASFHDLFVNTDLRLSSLHFAISSAVSSLILLAPGAWFCKQEEKNTDVSKEKYSESNFMVHSELFHLHFSSGCWLFFHEPWSGSRALNTTKGIRRRRSVKREHRFPQMTWNVADHTVANLIKLPWRVERYAHRTSPGFWSLGHRCRKNANTLVPSYFSAVGWRHIRSQHVTMCVFCCHIKTTPLKPWSRFKC